MAVSLAFRFVSGAYAATAWDSSANSGTVEWPPSPWRISRALLAVAHDRLGQEDLGTVMEVISVLAAEYPSYDVPPTVPHHTRHYLPDLDHRTGETGGTTLTLNSMLSVDPTHALYVTWPEADLTRDQADCLARCVSRLPYLGRADSLVEASMVADVPADNRRQRLTTAMTDSDHAMRLLCPTVGITREQLEVSPDQMRKARYLTPPGAEWIAYAAPREEVPRVAPRSHRNPDPTVVRWAWTSTAPLRATYGVLATDRLRGVQLNKLRHLPAEVPVSLTGHFPRSAEGQQSVRTDHGHAHWLWLADEKDEVHALVLWVPDGIIPTALPSLAGAARLKNPADGYTPRGFVEGDLQLAGIGRPDQVAPELIAEMPGARTWESASPYLLTRHMKRSRVLQKLVEEDVRTEWAYRHPAGAEIVTVETMDTNKPREYRRYRWKENMADRRQGMDLRITFREPQVGPILLGGLAHFGFGRFRPVPDS
ncbi:type I-U CRISPR-associated protein Csb2 [Raineyella sp. LH-20]|uniref:type I-G CRISPR-associated protein Csb2 n=1 Tax=Raineyella sp. LH-20 TaxID=3081204 RepID=UPI0029544016|nr:type I-U CRISPR-associated protein Csb2 [Raineyella sp. LH-20]WOP20062.1 type I-U CRISPR-associated protein Csb2 [Raineyella sp. LH-20]